MTFLELKAPTARDRCLRCGTCCQKGGPSFHHEDRHLIADGVIECHHLYTIRQGELAYDNVQGTLETVRTDIIKIKGHPGQWTCVFFDAHSRACRIYAHRPLECRALKCWDTRAIEQIYATDRLTRQDLLAANPSFWQLVQDHHERCSYAKLKTLADSLDDGRNQEALQDIRTIIGYDIHLRQLMVERAGMDSSQMDFLFGRPLTETLAMFGLKVQLDGTVVRLVPDRRALLRQG